MDKPSWTNPPSHTKLVLLSFALILTSISIPAAASGPDEGSIHFCSNSNGQNVAFEVLDSDDDNIYAAWVLKEVAGSDFRVGYENKHQRSTKATSIYVHSIASGGGELDHEYVSDENHGTGNCGRGPYETYTAPGVFTDVTISVSFSGMDVQITETEGESVTTKSYSETVETWGVEATASKFGTVVGSYENENTYGSEDEAVWEATSSVTWQSDIHGFDQSYLIDYDGNLHAT